MRKKTPTLKNKPDAAEKLAKHIAELGLSSAAEYQQWCKKHGFAASRTKRTRMLARELAFAKEQSRIAWAERARFGRRPTKETLLAIANRTFGVSKCTKGEHARFAKLARLLRRSSTSDFRDSDLTYLLEHLASVRSKLISNADVDLRVADRNGALVIEALVLIAGHRNNWIRSIESWKPRTYNARRQLRSLLRHLFDRYGEVPEFMERAWGVAIRGDGKLDPAGVRMRAWYLHIGRGHNLRDANLPIHYTKKMAHHFLRAPKDLTIHQALRWGQVRALGGSERLAMAIVGSRLGEDLDHDKFWITVVRWFTEQSMLDSVQVAPMIDYIHNQRFVPHPGRGPNGPTLEPLQPNFTIKGRTVGTLMRQVNKWHRALSATNRIQVKNWEPCGIQAFEFTEGSNASANQKVWTIRELLSTQSLMAEGRQLRHCVASYAGSCARGQTSIWTLEVQSKTGFSKLVTLEVRPATRTLVQARGKSNREMTEQERKIVRRWATAAGLTISRYV